MIKNKLSIFSLVALLTAASLLAVGCVGSSADNSKNGDSSKGSLVLIATHMGPQYPVQMS